MNRCGSTVNEYNQNFPLVLSAIMTSKTKLAAINSLRLTDFDEFDFNDLLRRVIMTPSMYALTFWAVIPTANTTVMAACAGSML